MLKGRIILASILLKQPPHAIAETVQKHNRRSLKVHKK